MSKAYTINPDKKIITINDAVKPTVADDKDIALYVSAGYIIRHKSEKRAKVATKRADNLNDATIKEALKGDQKALETYEAIKNKLITSFIIIKSFK